MWQAYLSLRAGRRARTTSEVNGQAQPGFLRTAERTQQQIAEYHRFRQLVKTLIEVNSRLCDTEMDEA